LILRCDEVDAMTVEAFLETVTDGRPDALRALWHDGHGDWERAHAIAQEDESRDGAWVHAYLHRKEGDLGNAEYWYRRAGRPVFRGELSDEWRAMVEELLVR